MITLPVIVNHSNATQLRDDGLKILQQNLIAAEAVIDATNLKEFDSALFAVLMAWKRVASNLIIQAAPEKVIVLSRVYGVVDLFKFRDA
jgi:ABC-type transporter Mla MlaB component